MPSNSHAAQIEERFPELANSVKRDGYAIADGGRLKAVLPKNTQLAEKETELHSLLDKSGFTVAKEHPDQAEWDCFISYASEDRKAVVEPLARELDKRGMRVWYDQWVLRIGDSLRRTIDKGLSKSKFGIVVLSSDFFSKNWPQRELDGLVQREVLGQNVILPIWHNVKHEDVAQYSLPLADKVAGSTSSGIPKLVEQLIKAMQEKTSNTHLEKQKLHPVPSPPASVDIGYDKLDISARLHRYCLTVRLTLDVPPDQGRLRMRIMWPKTVRIVKMSNIAKAKELRFENLKYVELCLDYDQRIFPGQTVDLVGPESFAELIYEYDDRIWNILDERPRDLICNVYFEDYLPVEKRVPFSELNVF